MISIKNIFKEEVSGSTETMVDSGDQATLSKNKLKWLSLSFKIKTEEKVHERRQVYDSDYSTARVGQ